MTAPLDLCCYLPLYAAGQLDGVARDALAAHMRSCEACRARFWAIVGARFRKVAVDVTRDVLSIGIGLASAAALVAVVFGQDAAGWARARFGGWR